jgi:hypothetical protein
VPIEAELVSGGELSHLVMNFAGNFNAGSKMDWFLKRVFLIWLFWTAVIIAAVLQMIHKSGGFN